MNSETQSETSQRSAHLDGLRGFAAFIVVVSHGLIAFDFALVTGQKSHSIVSWDVLASGAPFLIPLAGNLSVCVFFALSGFVLANAFSTTHLGMIALMCKRYVRFTLPILSACLISYALLAVGLMENNHLAEISKSTWLAGLIQRGPSFSQALQDGLYGALLLDSFTYDAALWTMPIEMWGSLVLIVSFRLTGLRKSSTRNRDRIILLSFLGVLGFGSYLGLFAFGSLMYLTQVHRKVNSWWAGLLVLVGVFLGTIPASQAPWVMVQPFTVYVPKFFAELPYPHSPTSFYHSVGAVLILIAANSFVPFRRMLTTPTFQFLGQLSFPLYLIHLPLLTAVVSSSALLMLKSGLPYAWTMVLSVVVLIVVSISAATALLFISERPSIALSKKAGEFIDDLINWILNFIRKYCWTSTSKLLGKSSN